MLCDVVSMHATRLLLGRSWQFDRKAKYNGFKNKYSFENDGKAFILISLSPRQLYENQLKLKEKKRNWKKDQPCKDVRT